MPMVYLEYHAIAVSNCATFWNRSFCLAGIKENMYQTYASYILMNFATNASRWKIIFC